MPVKVRRESRLVKISNRGGVRLDWNGRQRCGESQHLSELCIRRVAHRPAFALALRAKRDPKRAFRGKLTARIN
jgi:hypothetical protein